MTDPTYRRARNLLLAAAVLAGGAFPTSAQSQAPELGLDSLDFAVPPVAGGTADIVTGERPDERGDAILKALAHRVDAFRDAGYSLPIVDNTGAYWQITQETAYRLIEGIEDDCLAAVELKLYLDANAFETDLLDAVTAIDRPAMLALKLATIWALPEAVGVAGSAVDMLLGLKNRFSLLGNVANLMSSVEAMESHVYGHVASQRGAWALEAYREARREGWDADEIVEEQRSLVDRSQDHLDRINAQSVAFEAAVAAETTFHEDHVSHTQRAYDERMAWLATDEAERGEQRRRIKWLEDNRHTGSPRPDMGPIIDETRSPGEISYEWAVTQTEPGGRYYREHRAEALQNLQLLVAAETLRHEAALIRLANEYERAVHAEMVEVFRIEVERRTLERYVKPLALDDCEGIERLSVLMLGPVDDSPSDGTPNNGDGLTQAGETVRIPILVRNETERAQPAYEFLASAGSDALAILGTSPALGGALQPEQAQEHWITARIDPQTGAAALPFSAVLAVEGRLHRLAQLSLPLSGPHDEPEPQGMTHFTNSRRASFYNSTFVADLEMTLTANLPFRVTIETIQGDTHMMAIEFDNTERDIVIEVAATIDGLQFAAPDAGRRVPVIREAYWTTWEGQIPGGRARIVIPAADEAAWRTFGFELGLDIRNNDDRSVHWGGGALLYSLRAGRAP